MTFKNILNNLQDFKRVFVPGTFNNSSYTPQYAQKAEDHASNELSAHELQWVIDHKQQSEHVLDVGCNTGRPLNAICQAWKSQGTGIDINSSAITKASQDFSHYQFLQYDGETFPFEDNLFDHVMLHHVIGHVQSPLETIKNIHRVLRPDGTLSIITPNSYYKLWQFPWNVVRDFQPDTTVLRFFSNKNLSSLIRSSGFALEKLTTLGPPPQACPPSHREDSRLHVLLMARCQK